MYITSLPLRAFKSMVFQKLWLVFCVVLPIGKEGCVALKVILTVPRPSQNLEK